MAAPVNGLPAGWPGYLVGFLGLVFPFVLNWRKGKVDESAVVLGKWKELVEAHEGQIKRLTDEFDRHRDEARAEAGRLSERIMLLEQENSALKQRVAQLEDENAGLKRTIIQNSQSTGVMLGRPEDVALSKALKKEPKK